MDRSAIGRMHRAAATAACLLSLAACGGSSASIPGGAQRANTAAIGQNGSSTRSGNAAAATTNRAVGTAQAPAGGTLLFQDDFSGETYGATDPSWTTQFGVWDICKGAASAHAYCETAGDGVALAGQASWTDYYIDATLTDARTANSGVDLLGRVQDSAHYYELELGNDASNSPHWGLWLRTGESAWTQLAGGALATNPANTYHVLLSMVASTISAYIAPAGSTNYQQLGSASDGTYAAGRIGGRAWGTGNDQLDDVSVHTQSGPAPPPAPTGTPTTFSTSYSNASLPPIGWDNQATTGPPDAPDASRINWPQACADGSISDCASGDPPYDSNSSNIISNFFGNAKNSSGSPQMGYAGWCSDEGYTSTANGKQGSAFCQGKDTTAGIYFASPSDPLYKVTLTIYPTGGYGPGGPGTNMNGSSYNIALGSLPNMGGDGHLTVINESTKQQCEVWSAWSPHESGGLANFTTSAGGSFNAGSGSCGPLTVDEDGSPHYFNAYAPDINIVRFVVRPDEWVGAAQSNGVLAHAIYLSLANNDSAQSPWWPANHSDGQCRGGLGQEGMYVYLDTAGYRTLMASAVSPYRKAWLGTYHAHGAADLDSSGCGSGSESYDNTLTWDPLLWLHQEKANPLDSVISSDPADIATRSGGKDSGDIYYTFSASLAGTGLTLANFHILKQPLAKCLVQHGSPCS